MHSEKQTVSWEKPTLAIWGWHLYLLTQKVELREREGEKKILEGCTTWTILHKGQAVNEDAVAFVLVSLWQKQQGFLFFSSWVYETGLLEPQTKRRACFSSLLIHACWCGTAPTQTFTCTHMHTHAGTFVPCDPSRVLIERGPQHTLHYSAISHRTCPVQDPSPLLRRPTHMLSGDTTSCFTVKYSPCSGLRGVSLRMTGGYSLSYFSVSSSSELMGWSVW